MAVITKMSDDMSNVITCFIMDARENVLGGGGGGGRWGALKCVCVCVRVCVCAHAWAHVQRSSYAVGLTTPGL